MMNLLQKPINCYQHSTRYKALISLHVIDAITFIIRFTLVCVDLSQSQEIPSDVAYPVIIFFLELMSALPFFVSDILYCVFYCFKNELFHDDQHPLCCNRRTAFRIATLTCCPCQCYRDHPQGMQCTRVSILIFSFMIRFIAFVLGASCATTFNPRCVPYAVISSLALVPSLLTLVVEWLHFHLLWNFQPNVGTSLTKRRDRSHLRFIPENLANDNRTSGYAVCLCENGAVCISNSLNHTVLYHSIRVPRPRNDQRIIAYHVTTTDLAVQIAQDGFPVDHHRQVNREIYFIRTAEKFDNVNAAGPRAIICVRLSLGNVKQVFTDAGLEFGAHNTEPHLPQTLECVATGKIKVRYPGQIENWIIVLHRNANEEFDPSYYYGCV